jgi:hypothetical protein
MCQRKQMLAVFIIECFSRRLKQSASFQKVKAEVKAEKK